MATNDILWACDQLKQGERVRRIEWPVGNYVEIIEGGRHLEIYIIDDENSAEFLLTLEDLTAADWEVYVEQDKSDPEDEDAEE